mmetsp:Transcript_21742/g.51219  ORF Transcript_21742/g.51219 Transcript_21742/m.51219 type:complete len:169 (+) Transcript_21742:240-746(+)
MTPLVAVYAGALLLLSTSANAFQSTRIAMPAAATRRICLGSTSLRLAADPDDNSFDEESVVGGEQYQGSIDWDSEWKEVVKNKGQQARPDPGYKSQAQIEAIKATNKVANNVFSATQEMKDKLPGAPDIRSLQGDGRFWIGIVLVVSFGLSLLAATSSSGPSNESFYI